jgi:ABC-type antimicrobial peptide transport system permease subunit
MRPFLFLRSFQSLRAAGLLPASLSWVDPIRDTLQRERLMASLSGFFGLLAGLLATVGLYGVISFMLVRRRNEIGICMALGADRGRVLAPIMREAATLLAIGLVIGTGLSLPSTRAAASLFFRSEAARSRDAGIGRCFAGRSGGSRKLSARLPSCAHSPYRGAMRGVGRRSRSRFSSSSILSEAAVTSAVRGADGRGRNSRPCRRLRLLLVIHHDRPWAAPHSL